MPTTQPPTHAHTVLRIDALGTDAMLNHRLMQMGILPGSELTVVRSGSFGGPLELAADFGQSIALRRSDLLSLHWSVVALPLVAIRRVSPTLWRVVRLVGGGRFRERMRQRGVGIGAKFALLSLSPAALQIDGEVFRLGRGEAARVVVESIPG